MRLLGADVFRCANKAVAAVGAECIGDQFRQAEICDVGNVVVIEQDVVGRQVAVDDPLAVGIFQSQGDALDDLRRLL